MRAVGQDLFDDRMILRQFLQNVRTGGIMPLRILLRIRDRKLLKQHLRKLLRGIDVEGLPGQREDLLLQPVGLGF